MIFRRDCNTVLGDTVDTKRYSVSGIFLVSIVKNSIILKILICFTEHLLSDSFLLFYLQELTACKANSLSGGIFWSDSQQSPPPGCVLLPAPLEYV
jgi:hypothetical protein